MSILAGTTKNAALPDPAAIVVMGVSEFEDADWLHPAANVEKMHNGIPLTDEDRWPWLHAVAAWIDRNRHLGARGVIACSALKRCYRNILIGNRADVRLVYLKGDEELIARRIALVMSISCRKACFTVNSRRSKNRDQTKIQSLSRLSRGRAKSSHKFCRR
jgi:carbohydrate kinase (thermoresistant glucokinase family)